MEENDKLNELRNKYYSAVQIYNNMINQKEVCLKEKTKALIYLKQAINLKNKLYPENTNELPEYYYENLLTYFYKYKISESVIDEILKDETIDDNLKISIKNDYSIKFK